MKIFSLIVLLGMVFCSSACDCHDGNPHEIARKDNCITYQVGCESIYYTTCSGKASVSNNECHMVGKIMQCSSNTTFVDDNEVCCPNERKDNK